MTTDFTLGDHNGNKVTLSSFRGKQAVVVTFYPFAFTGTCTGELCELRDDIGAFQNENVQLLAISCDPAPSLRIFAEQQGYTFPLLSDFWPHGSVSRDFGVFDEGRGCSLRGTFIFDKEGALHWSVINGISERREMADYKTALAALQ
ncbi:MAG: peroxiredoxin [Actinomycetales bacterium]